MMLTFRPLRWYDCAFVYRLASEPTARAMFLDPTPPTLLGHLRHFWRDLTDPKHAEWIALLDGRRVGHVFADWREGWEISVNLLPKARGKGLGPRLIRYATDHTMAYEDGERLPHVAHVRPENAGSLFAFARAGYVLAPPHGDGVLRLEYRP